MHGGKMGNKCGDAGLKNERLDKSFRQTCNILFGEEIGALEKFRDYLHETMFAHRMESSCVSGKQVMVSAPYYQKGAKYASQDELARIEFKPLSINEIKDVDSLYEAASERAVYCGNKVFGKNYGASEVDNCVDSIDVHHSHDVYSSRNIAYCSIGRFAENLFGVRMFWGASHCMRCANCTPFKTNRCFEGYYISNASDCYYVLNCHGCSDCMFSFNLRSKNYAIGNLVLPKERYLPLKKKLLSEMAEKLRKDKRVFSIADIVGGSVKGKNESRFLPEDTQISADVEKAFASASKVTLGKEHNLGKLSGWLSEKIVPRRKVKGAFEKPTYWLELPILKKAPIGRLACFEDAIASSAKSISLAEGEAPSLGEIAKRAGKIAVFTFECEEGRCFDNKATLVRTDAMNTHGLWAAVRSSQSAFSSIVTESKYAFGGYARILTSEFCINCYNVTSVANCFETDSSYLSRNCCFCHNCENVESGIFCFNAKGLRYAVCNQEVGKTEFERVKRMLLEHVNDELEKKGRLTVGIFEVGTAKNVTLPISQSRQAKPNP